MTDRHLILLVEEGDSSLGIYDSLDGREDACIQLGYRPHEIAVSRDGRTAYVSNFGLHDYDLTLGYAGNSISVIDIPNRCELHRLYTCTDEFQYWAPHGVELSPDGKLLYCNVERGGGYRGAAPSEDAARDASKMLIFDVGTRQIVDTFQMPRAHVAHEDPTHVYGIPRGSHNFIFSPDGQHIWIFSGRGGITRINPRSGEPTAHLNGFNGAVRGLAFMPDGRLLVSATNEISVVDPVGLKVRQRIGNLGVTQLLYSVPTHDGRYVLAPAVWQSQLLVIDVQNERVAHRIPTGVDPVHVVVAPGGRSAYVTHGRSRWAVEIDTGTFDMRRRIETRGGPNGVGVAPWCERPARGRLVFGACLPFTGEHAAEGREMRLGYEFWQNHTNAAGGIVVDGRAHDVEIAFADTVSQTDEAGLTALAEKFVTEHGVQFLFGTYPPAANLPVARVAERCRIPFVTATGDEDTLYEQGFAHVFGVCPPSRTKLAGAIASLTRHPDRKPQTLVCLSSDDPGALADARATAEAARAQGLELVSPQSHGGGFRVEEPGIVVYDHNASLAGALRELGPDIVMTHGRCGEGVAFIEACRRSGFRPGAMALNCGITHTAFRTRVGSAAENLLGNAQWTSALQCVGHDRFVSAGDYARVFFAELAERPSELTAGASACGVVLEKALAARRSAAAEDVCAALREMKCATFFGPVQFDVRGVNTGKPLLTVQLRRVGNEWEELVVWPPEVAGQNVPFLPLPAWQPAPESVRE